MWEEAVYHSEGRCKMVTARTISQPCFQYVSNQAICIDDICMEVCMCARACVCARVRVVWSPCMVH